MLVNQFDYIVAYFPSLSFFNKNEALKSDLIIIRSYVPGGIYHSQNISWIGNLRGYLRPEDFIRSKKERKSIRKNRKYFEDQGFSFKIVKMTEDLYYQFKVLYEETTLNRNRAIRYNIEKILTRIQKNQNQMLVGMFDGDRLISALLFRNLGSKVSVSFGAKQKYDKTRGGVGGVLEMELLKYCFSKNIYSINHGQSLNPAGITGSSGIFEFKTRYGYTAFPKSSWRTTFIRSKKIAISDLVFVTINNDQLSYLVVSEDPSSDLYHKYMAKDVPQVVITSFDEIISKTNKFIETNV